jgi:hypothetical protein
MNECNDESIEAGSKVLNIADFLPIRETHGSHPRVEDLTSTEDHSEEICI